MHLDREAHAGSLPAGGNREAHAGSELPAGGNRRPNTGLQAGTSLQAKRTENKRKRDAANGVPAPMIDPAAAEEKQD